MVRTLARPFAMFALMFALLLTPAAARPAHADTPAPAASKPAAPAADPDHARLTAMCGTWDVAMTFWFKPGGAGVPVQGTSTIRPLFDGRFVEERVEGAFNGAPFTTLAWTGFNAGTRQYEATRISSTTTARIAETGSYDEKTNQLELKADYELAGETWHQRTVIQPASADSMTASSYLSFGKVPEWKAVEMRYTRKAQ
jgi:hypothetical protein